jgi:ferric-dicitrate binding protein FerR (iron transport regulator)
MHEQGHEPERDEGDLARLIAAVGPSNQPSTAATAQVRAAVEAEWRQVVAAQQRRRRFSTWAAAAGVVVAVAGIWLARPLYRGEPQTVATLARVVGEVQVDLGDGRWSPIGSGDGVPSGATLRTSPDGRAALRLSSGVQLRLDTGTRLAFSDAQSADLSVGAVYVDTGADRQGAVAAFVLDTPAGNIQHLGTQYAAWIDDDGVRIGVREGRVELSGARGAVTGRAGELLTVRDGAITRTPLPATASDWNWVSDVAPPYRIEGRTVDDFLTWATRETGRSLVYASPAAEQRAKSVTLSGTVEELAPDEAVRAVLATTTLRPIVGTEEIRVEATAP